MDMKQLKRAADGIKKHPYFALLSLAAALTVAGVVVGDLPQARASIRPARPAAVPSPTSAAAAHLSSVSPFGPVSQRSTPLRAGVAELDSLQREETASNAPPVPRGTVVAQETTSTEVAQAAEGMPGEQRVIAPRDMKDIQPPPLFAVQVPTPSDIDADGQNRSATEPPAQIRVPRTSASSTDVNGEVGTITAADATPTTASVFTPAQIKQAYGFAALPAPSASNKMAYQGSGQIIIILDAYHNATADVDLNTFSAKFGLPACTLIPNTYKAGAPINTLVTKPKAGDDCSFQVLYANSAGGQAANPPVVNAGWATEIALDVQWAHAMAPRAKIVLVEAASAGGNDLMNAMLFAGKLGGSVVSMSFGASEFSSGPSYDWIMTGAGITWVAASGDYGNGASWPSTSQNVLAVGGTALNNVSPRAESAWSGSGGGRTQFVPMPAWQSAVNIPGNTATAKHRGVPDVAYDASPSSGFYVYMSGKGYLSVGGTSAGSPQVAALVAIVDGVRAFNGKAPFGGTGFQQALYSLAANADNYKSVFLDVTSGNNGSCGAACTAAVGYDLVTGLGTPNVPALISALLAMK